MKNMVAFFLIITENESKKQNEPKCSEVRLFNIYGKKNRKIDTNS